MSEPHVRAYTLHTFDLADATDAVITDAIRALDYDRMHAWPHNMAISDGKVYLLIEHWRPHGDSEQDPARSVDTPAKARQSRRHSSSQTDDTRAAESVEHESVSLPLGEA